MIAREPESEPNPCEHHRRKVWYQTRAEARVTLKKMPPGISPQHVYRCPHCGHYFIGTSQRLIRRKLRRAAWRS